jgi:hypothetical protein
MVDREVAIEIRDEVGDLQPVLPVEAFKFPGSSKVESSASRVAAELHEPEH